MDFQKVMTMIDDISQHLPEQKYIEIVNNLKKEYDNANANDDDYDDDYIHMIYKQLEYEMYSFVICEISDYMLRKYPDDEIIHIYDRNIDDEIINKVFYEDLLNIKKINHFNNNFYTFLENKLEEKNNTYYIWEIIENLRFRKIETEIMIGDKNWFITYCENREDYMFGTLEFLIERVKWYLRQKFQTEKYINRCWSMLNNSYEDAYNGYYRNDYITDIQFPKDYFDNNFLEIDFME